jgi:hypothetical protein
MPPKPKRTKLQCDVCRRVFDSDYLKIHNQKYHADHGRKGIPFHVFGAPKNPFEVSNSVLQLNYVNTF